jgi:hypothetical protein
MLGQAPGKSRLAPSSISAGILLSRGWGPGANYSLLSCPNPRPVGEEHCFEGGKAWLTSHFEEATGVLSSNDAYGAIPIPSGGPIRPGREEINIETFAIREYLSMLASGGGLSYDSPAAASDRPSRLILIWLYLYVASHVSFT